MSNVVVLDNGAGLIKAGIGGERDPTAVVPNCMCRPLSKKWLLADPLLSPLQTSPPPLSAAPSMDEIVFEEFNFNSLFVTDPPALVHLYEASRRPYGLVSKTQCSLVVDFGFSFTHAILVFQNYTMNFAVKRLDLGGKALINYLKELVSYRAVNVMDETFIMDDVKEKLCIVSLDVAQDLQIATY
ncbi:unnamed protein product [Ilex paraguariensis]|uniref:Actin-related protein 6 n=2 Tax=Ilex paraguariensis TaxID=185542 RepID=A0ABC8TNA3_9AQUA